MAELAVNYKNHKTSFIDILFLSNLISTFITVGWQWLGKERIYSESGYFVAMVILWGWHENLSERAQVPFYDNFSHIELNMAISMSVLYGKYNTLYSGGDLQDFLDWLLSVTSQADQA